MSTQKKEIFKIKKQLPFSERFIDSSLCCLKLHLNVKNDSISKRNGN